MPTNEKAVLEHIEVSKRDHFKSTYPLGRLTIIQSVTGSELEDAKLEEGGDKIPQVVKRPSKEELRLQDGEALSPARALTNLIFAYLPAQIPAH